MSGARVTSARLGPVPVAVAVAIATGWALALTARATGADAGLDHDTLAAPGASLWPGLLLALASWQVMTAAMMLPSSLPMVGLFAQTTASLPRPGAARAAFLAGYAAVWTAFAAAAFLGDTGLHRAVAASDWLTDNDWMIGPATLALAGLFQFSSLKDACLRQCRNPGAFMLRHYERGVGGALRLGARHGAFCVGCCWALMLVMFAVGSMSLLWMGGLTLLMIHEKTRPSGARAVPVTGVALLGAASVLGLYSGYAAGALG